MSHITFDDLVDMVVALQEDARVRQNRAQYAMALDAQRTQGEASLAARIRVLEAEVAALQRRR